MQAVKLETARNGRTRYLVVVSRPIQQCRTDTINIDNNNTNNNNQQQSTNAQNVSLTKSCTDIGNNKCTLSSGSNQSGTSSSMPLLSQTNNTTTISIAATTTTLSSSSLASSSSLLRNNGKDLTTSISSTTKRQSYSDSAPLFNRGLVQMHTMTQTTAAHFDSLPQQCDNMINNNNINNNNNNNSIDNSSSSSSHSNEQQQLLLLQTINNSTSGSSGNLCGVGKVNTNSCDYQTNIRSGSGSSCSINDIEESCLLGIDCNERTTVGLVLRILADTAIRLDGDG